MQEITIKNRFTGNVIVCGKYKSIKDCLEKNKNASLRSADLRGADLRGADLRGADIRGAEMIYNLCQLYSLKLLPKSTKLRFWKYLKIGKSPYWHKKYEIGKIYREKNYDDNENELCSTGLNVATLMWCLKDSYSADEFIEVEFKVSDIVAIPYFSDGKFRVKRLKVLRKINRDKAMKEITKRFNDGKKEVNDG